MTLKETVAQQIQASRWPGYVYTYPHKKAYRLFEKLDMTSVWKEAPDKLNLYVHVPFCETRCTYCNLFLMPLGKKDQGGAQEYTDMYVDAVIRQIESYRPLFNNPEIVSVYFGGGTPNYFSLKQLDRIVDRLRQAFPNWDSEIEPSIECLPYLLDEEYLQGLREMGFRRISMGVQSLDHGDLKVMNRESDSARILDIYRLARQAGLNTNIDIIYGLPGQNMEAMIQNLMRVLSLSPQPSTINLYPLVVRELTGMAKIVPGGHASGEEKYEFFHEACRILAENGYQWESSVRFSLVGGNSTYKQQILEFEGICTLGLGSGARSYAPTVSYAQPYKVRRGPTKGIINAYIEADFAEGIPFEAFFFGPDELKRRFVIYSFLLGALDFSRYQGEYGESPDQSYPAEFEALREHGLVEMNANRLLLSDKGRRYHDIVVNVFESEQVRRLKDAFDLQ